jgi:hypothetical protein
VYVYKSVPVALSDKDYYFFCYWSPLFTIQEMFDSFFLQKAVETLYNRLMCNFGFFMNRTEQYVDMAFLSVSFCIVQQLFFRKEMAISDAGDRIMIWDACSSIMRMLVIRIQFSIVNERNSHVMQFLDSKIQLSNTVVTVLIEQLHCIDFFLQIVILSWYFQLWDNE